MTKNLTKNLEKISRSTKFSRKVDILEINFVGIAVHVSKMTFSWQITFSPPTCLNWRSIFEILKFLRFFKISAITWWTRRHTKFTTTKFYEILTRNFELWRWILRLVSGIGFEFERFEDQIRVMIQLGPVSKFSLSK